MADILILHPDAAENRRLRAIVRSAGYRCKGVYRAKDAIDWFEHSNQKALLITPTALLAQIRGYLINVPVLMLAGNCVASCAGLKACIPAGYSAQEILNTIEKLLTNSACMRTIGNLTLNTVTGEAYLNGRPMQLTTTESALLEALMASPDEPLSRDELLTKAWGYSCSGITRTVDVHVQRLRKKLGKDSIETVYRTGYRLTMA